MIKLKGRKEGSKEGKKTHVIQEKVSALGECRAGEGEEKVGLKTTGRSYGHVLVPSFSKCVPRPIASTPPGNLLENASSQAPSQTS